MNGKKLMKKLAACMLAGVMLVSSAVPAFAATTYTKTQSKVVDTGQSYHIMNNNISRNKISKYTLNILPLESGTRYDLAVAYEGKEEIIKNCTKALNGFSSTKATYVKSSASSNAGMIACIKVIKGSVQVKVNYRTTYKSAALTFKKQAASHQTLKGVTVKNGKKVLFQQAGSNITIVPLVIASKKGAVTRRALNTSSFENYTFNASTISYRYYKNGVLQSNLNKNIPYDSKIGTTGYIMVGLRNRLSGWFTTKSGSVTFYYPTDYLKITRTIK